MEAPDKIYLHKIRDEESSGFHKMWFEQRARCVPSEEYVRKNTLLEWLNNEVERYNDKLIQPLNNKEKAIQIASSISSLLVVIARLETL